MFLSGACLYVTSSHAPCSIEAVGAEAAFGQADGLDELLEFVEAQGGEAQAAAYLLDEALILG